MKAYFFRDGIKKLAREISGKENIYLGIRPYGFHSGNTLPLVVYPRLLARTIKKRGIEPSFKLFVFINDYEQYKTTGPDSKKYPFNIHPQHSTFQYTNDPENKKLNIVDRWQPVIEKKCQHY